MIKILEIINNNKETLAYLNNLESGIVRQVINGEYVISFTALIEPLKTEFLYDNNNLIKYNNDYFNIVTIEEEHDSDNMLRVYIDCEHISYDLIKQTKLTYTQTDRAAIYVMNDLLAGSGFNFIGTDVLTTASIDIQKETDLKSILYQVAVIWGGELSYFQNDIELLQQLGANRGADFRFGKNIQTINRLNNRVENTISYKVEIVQGTELQELGYFELGDTIHVVDDMLNIELDIRIIELEKDIVTGLNSRVILGQPISDLTYSFTNMYNNFSKNFNTINNVIDTKTIELNNAIQSVANDIQNVADGQIITYYQEEEPTGKFGDLWYNSTTKKLYRYSTKWDLVEDADITTAINLANMAKATADGKIVTYYQEIEPSGHFGDLWFNTITKKLYRYNLTWELIEDKDITTAIETAQNAQTTADGKIVSFYQDNIPTSEESNTGDLWIDTNDNNKLYRYNGTNWVSARDGSLAKIDNVIDEHGNLIASKLSGALNAAITKVQNSTSTVTFDDRGLITHNQPLESTSTKAILITSDGILIANAKNANGTWRWRTAITADGISANEINTGTLTAININGVNITGSSITSASALTNIVMDNGTLQFNRNNDTGQIKFAYRQGLPLGINTYDLRELQRYLSGIPADEKTLGLQCNGANFGIELGEHQLSINSNYGTINVVGGMTYWEQFGNPGQEWYVPAGWYKTARVNVYCDGVTKDLGQFGTLTKSGFSVYGGTKNAVISTETYGDICYSAYEMSEVLLGDIGENRVINGRVEIPIHQAFKESVDISNYHVFLTKYGKGDIWVSERTEEYFVVEGDNDVSFSWEIKANRKDASINRFMPVDIQTEKQKELYDEMLLNAKNKKLKG